MEQLRKPFQGIRNIVRFNWHFYALSVAILLLLIFLSGFAGNQIRFYTHILVALISGSILISLIVSCYIYDYSSLYKLSWLNFLDVAKGSQIVNINAGFDETSTLLGKKFDNALLTALDFYDPQRHTEVSIKRARNAYLPFPGTISVSTTELGLSDSFADLVFVILSAHEIRKHEERVAFFREAARLLKKDGQIIVTEHLRNTANFLAYNIGFFHFHSKKAWLTAFRISGLDVKRQINVTPFITTFVLEKYGTSS